MPPPDTPLTRRLGREHVLLTGATGFLGGVVLEKLLRLTPGGEPVFVLLRPRPGRTARERLHRLMRSPVLRRLRESEGITDEELDRRLVPVPGDLHQKDLGLEAGFRRRLQDQVSAVLHCAADCDFDAPLDDALRTNVLGARSVLALARDAGDVPLVHVSTAFVYGAGGEPVPEAVLGPPAHRNDPPEASAFDPLAHTHHLLSQVHEVRDAHPSSATRRARLMSVRAARDLAWGNAYTLSKGLGEMVLQQEHGRVPLRIVRPSIIEPSAVDPFPGWIDRSRNLSAFMVEVALGRLPVVPGRPGAALDVIPVDRVANAVLTSLPDPDDAGSFSVHHAVAGEEGAVRIGDLVRWMADALSEGATTLPGEPRPETMPLLEPDELDGLLRDRIRELRAQGSPEARREARIQLRIRQMTRLYEPFLTARHRLERTRLDRLQAGLAPADRALFPLGTADLDWSRYVAEAWLPAIQRLVTEAGTPRAVAP